MLSARAADRIALLLSFTRSLLLLLLLLLKDSLLGPERGDGRCPLIRNLWQLPRLHQTNLTKVVGLLLRDGGVLLSLTYHRPRFWNRMKETADSSEVVNFLSMSSLRMSQATLVWQLPCHLRQIQMQQPLSPHLKMTLRMLKGERKWWVLSNYVSLILTLGSSYCEKIISSKV